MTDETKVKEVEDTLAAAVEAAKKFHPIGKMFVNGYTGEVSKYKTPDNYIPDEGVCCSSPDLCHTEDYVSIAQMYERLKAMKALSIQDSDFDFDEGSISADDLDETTLSDVVSEVDDPSDYGNIVEPFAKDLFGEPSANNLSDSAAEKSAVQSTKDEERSAASDEE